MRQYTLRAEEPCATTSHAGGRAGPSAAVDEGYPRSVVVEHRFEAGNVQQLLEAFARFLEAEGFVVPRSGLELADDPE